MKTLVSVYTLLILFIAACSESEKHQADVLGPPSLRPPPDNPASPYFGLFCVPSGKLTEVRSQGFTLVRPPYGTEGECDYRDAGKPVALTNYIQAAREASFLAVMFSPDIRLWHLVDSTVSFCGQTWTQTVQRSKEELDSLYARLSRMFSGRIELIAYADEPLADASPNYREVMTYAQQRAQYYGIKWYIATMSPATPGLWYYPLAERLLITRYDVGAQKDNDPSTTTERWMNWDQKWNDYNSIRNASGKPISPIVAAHNWDTTAYKGFDDWGWPSQDEINRYIKCITYSFSTDMCWIYCGDDGTENLWNLPPYSPQIQRIYTAVQTWPYAANLCLY